MIVDIGINGVISLICAIWYLSIKLNSIKTVGTCKKKLDCSRGFKEVFEYEVDGVKYYNAEKTMHLGSCKVDKKYTIYVDKKNYEKIVSSKVVADAIFFTIFFGVLFISMFYLEYIHG